VLEPPLADEALRRASISCRVAHRSCRCIGGDLLVQALGACAIRFLCCGPCSVGPARRPDGRNGLVEPGAPSTMRNSGRRKPRLMRSSARCASLGALTPMLLDREQHLLAVLAYAKDDKERDGSRFAVEPHGTTVPSRMRRTIGSSASERAVHVSSRSSPCARPGSPYPCRRAAKQGASARRTRRVLVPAR